MEVQPLPEARARSEHKAGSRHTATTVGEGPRKRGAAVGKRGGSFARPSHVLFSVFAPDSSATVGSRSSAETRKDRRCLRIDPRLEQDYVRKRKRAFDSAEWASGSSSTATTNVVANAWEGVSKVERDIVGCCQQLDDDFFSRDNDSDSEEDGDDDENDTGGSLADAPLSSSALSPQSSGNHIGGVLAVEKETRFAAILSRDCHTMASRSLALAVLERTLEVHLKEEANTRWLQQEKDNHVSNGNDESITNTNDIRNVNKLNTPSPSSFSPVDTGAEDRKRRFEYFFAAGGLKILNQWLGDASSYETKTTSLSTTSNDETVNSVSATKAKKKSREATTVAAQTIRKAHATRPLALSILLFLERIPFEKKTVVNSKINKQIQKLGKKLASIQEAYQSGEAREEDVEGWTTHKPEARDKALTQIMVAVDAVKASWREKAKTQADGKQPHEPFDALQSKIKERLGEWNQFECGAVSTRPEWYRPVLAVATTKKKSPTQKREATSEAEMEKARLQKKIKQVQSRSQKSLQQLREKLRRRKVEQNNTQSFGARNSLSSFSNSKKVVWKDGLKSQGTRNRKMLEEVFVFGTDLPSNERN